MNKRRRLKRSPSFKISLIIVIVLIIIIFNLQKTSEQTFINSDIAKDKIITYKENTKVQSLALILDEVEYKNRTIKCLISLCDTGASDEAVVKVENLINELNKSSQTFAKSLLAVLNSTVSYLNSSNGAMFYTNSDVTYLGISNDLIHQAIAACYEKSLRKSSEIVLSFAGDCTFGTINGIDDDFTFPTIYKKSGSRSYPFDNIKPWFFNDDLTSVNFEGTLTNESKTADKQWKFKGLADYAKILPASSVEDTALSNNHSFDYLKEGFKDTKLNLQKENIGIFYENTPYITTIKGVETVIIGDCSIVGENTTVTDGVYERVLSQIRKYKKPDNIVAVVMHWGSELDKTPTKWEQDTGRKFIDDGADVVVGQHPHVVQGIELYKGKYIVYSLGNFAFGGNHFTKNPETFVFRIVFSINDGKTNSIRASIVPCYTSSSVERNSNGVLRNNFQPKPLFGIEADHVSNLILERSRGLSYGIKKIDYFNIY